MNLISNTAASYPVGAGRFEPWLFVNCYRERSLQCNSPCFIVLPYVRFFSQSSFRYQIWLLQVCRHEKTHTNGGVCRLANGVTYATGGGLLRMFQLWRPSSTDGCPGQLSSCYAMRSQADACDRWYPTHEAVSLLSIKFIHSAQLGIVSILGWMQYYGNLTPTVPCGTVAHHKACTMLVWETHLISTYLYTLHWPWNHSFCVCHCHSWNLTICWFESILKRRDSLLLSRKVQLSCHSPVYLRLMYCIMTFSNYT